MKKVNHFCYDCERERILVDKMYRCPKCEPQHFKKAEVNKKTPEPETVEVKKE